MDKFLLCSFCDNDSVHFYITDDNRGISHCKQHYPYSLETLPEEPEFKYVPASDDGIMHSIWGVRTSKGVSEDLMKKVYYNKDNNKPF